MIRSARPRRRGVRRSPDPATEGAAPVATVHPAATSAARLPGGGLGSRLARVLAPAFALALLLGPSPSLGHPFGLSSIDQNVAVRVGPERIDLVFALDMAEAVSAQLLQIADRDGDTVLSPVERADVLAALGSQLVSHLHITAAGVPVRLTVARQELLLPRGELGLVNVKARFWLAGRYPPGTLSANTELLLSNANYPDRAGERAFQVQGDPMAALRYRILGEAPVRGKLRHWGLRAVYRASDAAIARAPGLPPLPDGPVPPAKQEAGRSLSTSSLDPLAARLGARSLSLWVVLAALGLAFLLGAFHALSPGHGKALVAAYLVGSRGTVRHALLLGLTVTATHVVSVLVLGLVTLFLSAYVLPETLVPWLNVTSGLLVLGVGLLLVVRRSRALRSLRAGGPAHIHAPDHAHPSEHDHGHEHGHEAPDRSHGHAHGPIHHHPATVSPARLTEVFWLGVSGGLVPCPSALLLLLVAVNLQRVAFGLLLIVVFSVGLAAVLVAIGVLVVKMRGWLDRRAGLSRRVPYLGVISAVAVALLGVAMTLMALLEGGFFR